MPFPAIWTRSQRGQLSADYESIVYPGNTFIFLLKRKTQDYAYFRCAHCAKAMKYRARRGASKLTIPIVRASIEQGFIDDPDKPTHRHFCIEEDGVDTSKVKLELLEMPMTPGQAMAYMEAEVIANFPDSVSQQEIICRLPSDKSAKRSFARRSSVAKKNFGGSNLTFFDADELGGLLDDGILGEDAGRDPSASEGPMGVPLELLNPFLSRPSWICAPGRAHLPNFFLIYRDPHTHERPFIVFADIMGLNLLHKCSNIVCDGNSNFYPSEFAQLYTFHAVHHSIPEEAHLAAFALLPNTSSQTYVKLFGILSERIGAEYGNNGAQKNWHFDNQLAAISACRAIFVDDIVEGSEERTVNFAQLWHNHLGTLFSGTQPDLLKFIRVMREELARASIQAERIFKRPAPVKRVNLDDLDYIRNYSLNNGRSHFSRLFDRSKRRQRQIDAFCAQINPSPCYALTMGQRRRKQSQQMPVEIDQETIALPNISTEHQQKVEDENEKDCPLTAHRRPIAEESVDEKAEERIEVDGGSRNNTKQKFCFNFYA
uniref:MULE domain-containing protein n=1 Tax=Globodera pallida TaxID=36090 RepID=A0A183C9K2_GLOPA